MHRWLYDFRGMKKRVHALLSLTLIEGLGPVKLKRLLEKKGSPITFLKSFNYTDGQKELDVPATIYDAYLNPGNYLYTC